MSENIKPSDAFTGFDQSTVASINETCSLGQQQIESVRSLNAMASTTDNSLPTVMLIKEGAGAVADAVTNAVQDALNEAKAAGLKAGVVDMIKGGKMEDLAKFVQELKKEDEDSQVLGKLQKMVGKELGLDVALGNRTLSFTYNEPGSDTKSHTLRLTFDKSGKLENAKMTESGGFVGGEKTTTVELKDVPKQLELLIKAGKEQPLPFKK